MDCPEISSLSGKNEYLIVLVHGVGSDGDDLMQIIPSIQHLLPDGYFISPHGIEPYDMAPYGRQWFSLQNRDVKVLTPLIAKSIPKFEEIINLKQQELGLDNTRTILIGFSQGTMLSLSLTLTVETPFLACVGFSGALIPPEICNNTHTDICLIHGSDDDVVPIEKFYLAEKYLATHHVPYQSHEISNLRHSINNQGLNIAIEFIKKKVN